MAPVRVYETDLYGQRVTVRVFPAQPSTPPTWTLATRVRYSVDQTFYETGGDE